MSERLVVRLGSQAQQPIPWVTWSEQQQGVISSGVLPNAEALVSLAERAGGRPVEVLVDSSAITFTSVTVPAKAQRQALKALPFMLEDGLAQDVELLHFVPGPRQGDTVPVAIVSHAQVQLWQHWLAEAGLPCTRMVPDILALPLVDGSCVSVLQLEEQLLLRSGTVAGQVMDVDWLSLAVGQYANAAQPWALFTPLELPAGVESIQQPLELPMEQLAAGFMKAPLSLLTGPYAPSKELGNAIKLWAKVGIAASVLFVLTLINDGLQVNQLQAQRDDLRTEQELIYRSLFPNEKRVVNARSQLQAKVRALGAGGSSGELFAMLKQLQPSFQALPGVKPQGIKFDASRGEIRLQLSGKDFAQIEKFSDSVKQQFSVQTGALNNDDNGVSGTLTVRAKG
ncbi:type II secretion system protein GspL [Ferrimonas lipolytica]|uniref:Type II secretion system protein L n=1 Tax=Ferrimonas lipolytica TaxID=2724191 RepID=A0A6H1UIG4_9GAMM|nr:type II secretion system protein GspL [Ferrimonas lipolytica]QIZ78419.1 type II secretion system protein GspL [Ferrimonas lipolytica]